MSFRSNFLLQRSSDLKSKNEGGHGEDRHLILLVAREDAELEELATLFEEVDIEILSAREEGEALEKIRVEQPVLVVSRFPLNAEGYRMARRQTKQGDAILVLVPTEKVDEATGKLTAEQLTPLLNLIAGQTLPHGEPNPTAAKQSTEEVEVEEIESVEPVDEPGAESPASEEQLVEGEDSEEEFFGEDEQWLAQPDSSLEGEDSIERTFDLVDAEGEGSESDSQKSMEESHSVESEQKEEPATESGMLETSIESISIPKKQDDPEELSPEELSAQEGGSKTEKIRAYLEEFRRVKSGETGEIRRVPKAERGFDDLFGRFFEAESSTRDSRRSPDEEEEETARDEPVAAEPEEELGSQEVDRDDFAEENEAEDVSLPSVEPDMREALEEEGVTESEPRTEPREPEAEEESLEMEQETRFEEDKEDTSVLGEDLKESAESADSRVTSGSEAEVTEGSVEPSLLEKSLEREKPSFLDEITREELERAVTEEGLNREREMAEWVSPELEDLYLGAVTYVLRSIRTADGEALPDLEEAAGLVAALMDSLDEDTDLLLAATNREQEFAVSTHSANVAILSLWIARAAGAGPSELSRIGLAALLHEVGVVKLPESIMHRADDLTEEQIRVLRCRPLYSREVLEAAGSGYQWLPEMVGQVYERSNGGGYPLGLSGREIVNGAQLIGVADVIEACIHRRPYREALTGYQALFELTTEHARAFPDNVVKAAIRSLSLYPYNEYVVLDSGEIGQVKAINEDNLSRPCAQILFDASGKRVSGVRLKDLSENSSAYIAKAIRSCDLPEPVGD